MGIADLYQADVDKALTTQQLLPPPPPKPPERSVWSAVHRGISAGFSRIGAAVTESAAAVPEDDAERRRRDAMGVPKTDFAGAAKSVRDFERGLRPDPATASTAEQVVFGLSNVLTQVAAGAAVAGPLAGAVVSAAGEGATTADDLARAGVDKATRTKAGIVSGVSTGAGAVLPLVGSTVPRTLALYVAGGPGQYIAQQAATRAILERADYKKLAEQFDPLDPTGLTLASLIPAPFALWGIRGNIKAKGLPLPERAPVGPSLLPEQTDAAMVHNLSLSRDVAEATPAPVLPVETMPAPVIRTVQPELPPPSPFKVAVDELARALPERDPAQVIAAIEKTGAVDPLVRNALVGVMEAGGDAKRLADLTGHAEALAKLTPDRPAGDIMADAVEMVRAGEPVPTAADAGSGAAPYVQALQSRAGEVEMRTPDLVVRTADDGSPVTVRDEMARIRREVVDGTDSDLGLNDARLIEIAANCALSLGAG